MSRVCVVIPAAGDGTRIGGQPKQFRALGGAPLLYQTSLAFERHEKVESIVVVAPKDSLAQTRSVVRGLDKIVGVIPGGATRQDSVTAGMQAVPAAVDIVLVHDAARPFIEAAAITAVITAAVRYGAAAMAIPVVDTVRYAEGGFFTSEISRKDLFAVQTPQGFSRTILAEALQRDAGKSAVTDETALVRASGRAVRMVPGHVDNFKITVEEDWTRAQRMWPEFALRNYGA